NWCHQTVTMSPRFFSHLLFIYFQLCGQHGDNIQFTRDHLLLKDGGVVALDWAVGTRLGEAAMRKRWDGRKALGCFTSAPPVLLLIPQSWGGMSPHLKLLSLQATRQGFYVVVFHHRGTAGTPLTTARLTEFGDPADLEQAVSYVHSRHLSSVLVAVSEGSGSGVLLSYLGEHGSSTYLTAAAAISPVLLGQLWFEAAMPPVYRWAALFRRKTQLSSFRGVLDVDRALSCSNLRDFEEALFSHQAKNWESYWERNEPLRDADEAAVPVLCICSRDDPVLTPASTLPLSLFLNNPYFLLVLTDRGGHCGFTLEGREEMDDGIWSHSVALEYFKVVAEFLKDGEREGASWRGEVNGQIGQRSRVNAGVSSRGRRATVTRRPRAQVMEQSCTDDGEGGNYTWRRSYTH
uniref:Protein ABHD15-like n=1 Tax=Kryptolebias marmoratus TaxID=37003 RepID=A0A3Q3ADX8_KRYMA